MQVVIIENQLKEVEGKIKQVSNYRIADIDSNLDTWYKIIGCSCIDIQERKIGNELSEGRYFDIILDDEGRFNENNCPSIFLTDNKVDIVGNIIICRNNKEGETIGLTNDDVAYLLRNLVYYTDNNDNNGVALISHYEDLDSDFLAMFGNNIISM